MNMLYKLLCLIISIIVYTAQDGDIQNLLDNWADTVMRIFYLSFHFRSKINVDVVPSATCAKKMIHV